ncbi:MAG: alpha-ketoacid dehydrogenase subunit beta [Promethearchaeota archaeon]
MIDERKLDYLEAIREAIFQEMERNERIIVLGEDVEFGGFFSATEGLKERFGTRVRNTPISESAFLGAAVGAAIHGLQPIVELLYVDFVGVCFDMVLNHLSKIHYMSGGTVSVPLVLRAAVGGGYQNSATHSQTLWGTFAHLPGLKVVAPATPYDAKGMLIEAIRSKDPVIFLEHKMLYNVVIMTYGVSGPVPEERYTVPFKACLRREGSDLSIITLSLMVHRAEEAAEELAKENIDVEILDLRTLVPLDRDAIIRTAQKTGRVLVVDEDYQGFGLTGEIAATLLEHDPAIIQAFQRLAVPDVPLPVSRVLEEAILPNSEKIQEAAKNLVQS